MAGLVTIFFIELAGVLYIEVKAHPASAPNGDEFVKIGNLYKVTKFVADEIDAARPSASGICRSDKCLILLIDKQGGQRIVGAPFVRQDQEDRAFSIAGHGIVKIRD